MTISAYLCKSEFDLPLGLFLPTYAGLILELDTISSLGASSQTLKNVKVLHLETHRRKIQTLHLNLLMLIFHMMTLVLVLSNTMLIFDIKENE